MNAAEIAAHRKRLAEMEAEVEDINSKVARFKGMLYGPSGTGKTVLALRLMQAILEGRPKNRIVYVDTSEGWTSIRNHPGLAENVLFVPFKGYDYLETVLFAINANAGKFANVGGIILDEATKMSHRDLERVFVHRSETAKTKPEAPEWPDFYRALTRMKMLLTFIYENAPDVNLIMVGHEKDKKNKDTGAVVFTYPSFNPQVAEEVKGDLQLLGRVTAKQTGRQGDAQYAREIQVHPTTLIDAKTRVSGLPVKTDAETLIAKTVEWLQRGAPDERDVRNVMLEQATHQPVNAADIEARLDELDTDDDAPVFVEE